MEGPLFHRAGGIHRRTLHLPNRPRRPDVTPIAPFAEADLLQVGADRLVALPASVRLRNCYGEGSPRCTGGVQPGADGTVVRRVAEVGIGLGVPLSVLGIRLRLVRLVTRGGQFLQSRTILSEAFC